MIKDAKRISIVGGCGSGKTTLADNISKEMNIPVYHLDGMHYDANWVEKSKVERDKVILEKIQEDAWVIDGVYRSTLERRLNRSDLVIFLDYSTFALTKGILGRYLKNHGKEKSEIPGCREQLNWKFFCYVLKWRKNKRPCIASEISKIKQSKVLIFKSRRKMNKWYMNEFNEKMTI